MHILYPRARIPGPGTATADTAERLRAVAQAGNWPWTPVDCGDDSAYEDAVRAAWRRGEAFTVVEHDVGVTHAALAGLAACPHSVCAVAYPLAHPSATLRTLAGLLGRIPPAAGEPPLLSEARAYARSLPSPAPDVVAWQTWAHRVTTAAGWRWVETGEAWADAVGLGCTRLRPGALPPADWGPGTWDNVDSRLSAWLAASGVRMHIHWPSLPHWHDRTVDSGAPNPASVR